MRCRVVPTIARFFAIAALVSLIILALPGREATAPREPENAAYVWQRQWTPAVSTGILQAANALAGFMVLAAEADAEAGVLRWNVVGVEWATLAAANRDVFIVLRIHELPGLAIAESRDESADAVARAARNALDDAAKVSVRVRGVQLDYDCPTEGLGDYARFLRALRGRLRGVALSITALPAWLPQPEFADVVEGLDHYVLQVHSLDKPAGVNEPPRLCDPRRVLSWVRQASGLGRPFYVALPTYGYRLFFDAQGDFVGLAAEGTRESFTGCTTREVFADPEEIAGVVRTIEAAPPACWQGFAWFRLPVAGDQLNWTWPLLEQVMAGHVPKPELHAEVRNPTENLYEVWLTNTGVYRPVKPIRLPVDWTGVSVVAYDTLATFSGEVLPGATTVDLTGSAPPPGEEVMTAWFRVVRGGEPDAAAFHAGSAEVVP